MRSIIDTDMVHIFEMKEPTVGRGAATYLLVPGLPTATVPT